MKLAVIGATGNVGMWVVPEALGGGHRDLTVRVATYISLFVELSKELQDDIVARIEFE